MMTLSTKYELNLFCGCMETAWQFRNQEMVGSWWIVAKITSGMGSPMTDSPKFEINPSSLYWNAWKLLDQW